MIRPPLPLEVIHEDDYNKTFKHWFFDDSEYWCMQEALTAEWLIEYGFMPDPSEMETYGKIGNRIIQGKRIKWHCEDKTQ